MSGIRTNAAAELLGVSPNTLRSWERRFGYPAPRRSSGGHRQYELAELEALRRALLETHNISSAIQVAQQRGEGPGSANRLLEAFDRFDDQLADRFLEESLSLRSIERTVEELLLPAIELAEARDGREAECEFGFRWATGWLHAQRRVAPQATRDEGILLFESNGSLGSETLQVQALELALRRAGFRVLLLSVALAQERLTRAMRVLDPRVLVLCGSGSTLDSIGRLVYSVRHTGSKAPLYEYRGSMPVTGAHKVPSLGDSPTDAVRHIRALIDGPSQRHLRSAVS
ncbi:MAG: MerR family transcriptional regulator, light-induced transcriptional regulator [Thermoleophilaceae bacterium]|jgi:DNA-binding transcriptional MerR regulator|nr:MerR family transcriptional regulator, light-induced transcriptional regulator [Thermoleophilaceae bacterium]